MWPPAIRFSSTLRFAKTRRPSNTCATPRRTIVMGQQPVDPLAIELDDALGDLATLANAGRRRSPSASWSCRRRWPQKRGDLAFLDSQRHALQHQDDAVVHRPRHYSASASAGPDRAWDRKGHDGERHRRAHDTISVSVISCSASDVAAHVAVATEPSADRHKLAALPGRLHPSAAFMVLGVICSGGTRPPSEKSLICSKPFFTSSPVGVPRRWP